MSALTGPVAASAERRAALGRVRPLSRRRRLADARTRVQAVLILLWCLLPVYWMLVGALRDTATTFETTPVPTHPTLRNFVAALNPNGLLLRGLANSLGIALVVTVLALAIGTTAAYALARFPLRGKDLLLGAIVAASMLPGASLATPLYGIWAQLQWSYSYQAIVLPYLALALPLAVSTLASFLGGLPWELEEAARVDGCTRGQAFRHVMLPLAAPAVFTTAILTFIASWNEYVLASVLTNERTLTATVVVGDFAADLTGYTTTMAAGVIATAPMVALVLLFQRRIVAGLTLGSVRG